MKVVRHLVNLVQMERLQENQEQAPLRTVLVSKLLYVQLMLHVIIYSL